jgi:hypothetical protein
LNRCVHANCAIVSRPAVRDDGRRMISNLHRVLPDEDYGFHMRFERGNPAAFFAPTSTNRELLAERKHWLDIAPETYAALLPAGEPLLQETLGLAQAGNGFAPLPHQSPFKNLLALGQFWEVDFLLLKPDSDGAIRLQGGCLCFPSSWRLSDKIGQPMDFVHAHVPGLNASLGPSIHKFLSGLKPGVAWLRSNWGLSRSAELNQHPDRHLPRLDANPTLEQVFFRVEQQALIALPESRGILFGIRIEISPLVAVLQDAEARSRLRRALATMPLSMAEYKGLATARATLLRLFT